MSDAQRCAERERVAYGAAGLLVDEALRGNVHAAVSLVELAARLCDAVDHLPAGVVNEIAVRRVTWPGLLGAHPAAITDTEAKLRRLGLGSRHRYAKIFGVPTGPKRPRMDSPAQAISIDCLDSVVRLIKSAADKHEAGEAMTPEEVEAHELPTLDKASFERWFALGWKCYAAACLVEVRGVTSALDPKGSELARRHPTQRKGLQPARKGNDPSLASWLKAEVKEASKWWIPNSG